MIKSATLFDFGITTSGYITAYAEAPVTPDAAGVKWGLFDCDGWNDGVDVKQNLFERPHADGAIYDEFHYAPRVMELHGGLVAPDRRTAVEAVRRLKAAFALRDGSYDVNALKYLVIDEYAPNHASGILDYGSYFTFCRRAGKISAKPSQYGVAYEWSVPIVCPDPLKYAINQIHATSPAAAPAVLTISSAGTMPVLAEFYITGPVTNPILTHNRTGWFMKFNGSLTAGQTVGFNCALHSAGGTLDRTNVDVSSRWFPVMPGVNVYTLSGAGQTSATKVECYWYDGYE